MRLDEVHARRFAKEEYGGFEHTNIDGENLLIYGENRTGKTLTFNAILYNLLGPRETIDLSTGRGNEVRLDFSTGESFRRGESGSQFVEDEEELDGDAAREALAARLITSSSEEIDGSEIIKNHFIHSHIRRMPLGRLNKDDRLAHVRTVVDRESQEEIEESEARIASLEESLVENKESLRRREEDRKELKQAIRSAENQLEKYQQVQSLIESGELQEIITLLEENTDLKAQLSELSREEEFLRQKKRSKQKERSKWERYRESERNSLIAEAVNDFVCPGCADRVDPELAKTRLSGSRCPFCAVEDRADQLETDVDDKISRSEEELEELSDEIEDIDARLEEISDEMAELRDSQPELERVSGPVETIIRQNKYTHEDIVEEVEEELDRYKSAIEGGEDDLQKTIEQMEDLRETVETQEDELEAERERLQRLRQESLEAEVDEFAEEWDETFQSIAGEIGLDIRISEDGDVEIPGQDGIRYYDRAGDLSDAEITFLNISFSVTYSRFTQKSDITPWSTIVLDEPFANLDQQATESLLEYIAQSEEQYICTSSNEVLLERFPKTGQLTRQSIQSSLTRFQ